MKQIEFSDVVLVVDDSPDLLSLVNDALEESGYSVLVALEGRQALTISSRIRPDIILLDACMPGMDGFETCRRLKKNPALASIPVIFMTGLGEPADVVRGLEAGGVDYLAKPVSPDELIARIQVHLKNARITNSAYRTLDTSGQHLIVVNDQGLLTWSSPQAGALLTCDNLSSDESVEALTQALSDWVSAGPKPGDNHAFNHCGNALTAALVETLRPGENLLRLVPQKKESSVEILRNALSLTPRESEVLFWLSNGKTNKEIAEILEMSPRTVNKHLEQVFPKLGVENRTTAARIALSTLNDH